jgi:lipopolysaccharide biosynthesis glycosyltransferase
MLTERIPIFFAANVGFYQHLCVTLCSLLENNKNLEFDIYVLTDDAKSKENKKILKMKQQYKNVDIIFQKISEPELLEFVVTMEGYTLHTYYRYFIPRLFQNMEKALYLDCDTLVEGKIDELWETNLYGYYVAGVKDLYIEQINHKSVIGFTQCDLYVNAGMLLMNLQMMREDNISDLLNKNTKILEGSGQQDQDVINYTLKGKIKELGSRFNWATSNSVESKQNSLSHKPIIISHFTGRAKPWNPQYKCSHESANRYFYYLSKTPYRNFIYRYRIEHFFRYSIKAFVKTIVKKLLPKNFVKFVRLYHQHIFVSNK